MKLLSVFSQAVNRVDGWYNLLTGQGTDRDKTEHTKHGVSGWTDDDTLETLFNENAMAARLCEAPGDHMLRGGFKVIIPDNPELGKAIDKSVAELLAAQKLKDAKAWDRCYGGSVIVLGANDGRDASEPLDEKNIQGFTFLNVLDKRFVWPLYWYTDPSRPKYGLPSVYRLSYVVQGTSDPRDPAPPASARIIAIHESRLVVFTGDRATIRTRIMRQGWGNSVLSRSFDAIRSYDSVWKSIENIVMDASQGVFKIKDFHQKIAGEGFADVMLRLKMMDMSRSSGRAIAVDADTEDFERKGSEVSGLADLVDRSGARLAAVGDVPVTVLLGISPGGLNATGASDIRNWYDKLEAERDQDVDPKVRQIVRLVMLDKNGPCKGQEPKDWSIKYAPLWQETALEKAQTALVKTQSDTALIQAGVHTAEEVAIKRAEELEIKSEPREKALAEYHAQLASGEGELDPVRAAETPEPKLPTLPGQATGAPSLPKPAAT